MRALLCLLLAAVGMSIAGLSAMGSVIEYRTGANVTAPGRGDQIIVDFGAVSRQKVQREPLGPPPQITVSGGTALVPLRYIAEWLGAVVSFDAESQTIALTLGGRDAQLKLGSDRASVGGETITLANPAREVAGVTYVPLRFCSEALGAKVDWDAKGRTATVHHPLSGKTLELSEREPEPEVLPQDGQWQGEVPGFPLRFVVSDGGSAVMRLKVGTASQDPRTFPITHGMFAAPGYTYGEFVGEFITSTTAEGSLPVERWDGVPLGVVDLKWRAKWIAREDEQQPAQSVD